VKNFSQKSNFLCFVPREQKRSKEEARLTIEKVDKMRENYVQEFTGTSRYDTRNYQLVINMRRDQRGRGC